MSRSAGLDARGLDADHGLVRRLALLVLLATTACGGSPAAGQVPVPSFTPTAAATAASSPGAPTPAPATGTTFVVVLENRTYTEAMAMPYVAQLANRYALATDYHGVAHPSLPNYLALTSGSTWGIQDDGYHALPAGGLGKELTDHGVSWRAYMEGMTRGCLNSPAPYAVKHDPFAYYGGGCPANVVPLTALDSDLAAGTPRFVWITPDLCHDGHDCGTASVDGFLSSLVPKLVASAAWQQGGALFLTWDESDDSGDGNRVPALVIAPDLAAHRTSRRLDHYSLLATVEDRLGVPRLGHAVGAPTLGDLLAA